MFYAGDDRNEMTVNRDIIVLANPEIATPKLGDRWWLQAACTALSTAAGLLLVISTSVSHDLLKRP